MGKMPTKRCTKCNREFPSTDEFFVKSGYGFRPECKECHRAYYAEYRRQNRKHLNEYNRKWVEEHLDSVHASKKAYEKRNRDKKRKSSAIYRAKNKDKRSAYNRKWEHENRSKARAKTSRRRAIRKALPANFTDEHWQYALDYFHGCCAVCGRPLNDLFGEHTAAMDHWIPLSSPDCSGTIPENIVPLCHGVDGCNNSKSNKMPEDWLIQKFGKRKAREILSRIEAYFNSQDAKKERRSNDSREQ